MKKIFSIFLALSLLSVSANVCLAQNSKAIKPTVTPLASPTLEVIEIASPKPDITQKTETTLSTLESLLETQKVGKVWPWNPVKYAIRSAVNTGVPINTIVLLLLLPVVASFIAIIRQLIGIRGFGIFLPAALSVTFVAMGPIVGISLFLAIVAISTIVRFSLRKFKIRLSYLPRMALILWFVSFGVLGILFASPLIKYAPLQNVSIFPVLVLTLLVEDFTRIQMGKSIKTAFRLTFETLLISLLAFLFLTLEAFQKFVLLNPEIVLLTTFVIDIILGKFIGLRFLEYLRFRQLIKNK